MREARIHVRHIRDLLKSVDPADAYNGVDCNSLSFLNTVTVGDILGIKLQPDLYQNGRHLYGAQLVYEIYIYPWMSWLMDSEIIYPGNE